MTLDDSNHENKQGFDDPRLAALYDIECSGRSADTDFYLALAAELGANTIVDIGCGTGVLAVDLAAAGHVVIGLDPSPAMLAIARSRPGGGQVSWIHGYADRLPDAVADLVVMTGHAAQYFLTDEAWLEVLGHAHRALRPGGRLAFEMRNPLARGWESWTEADSRRTYPHPDGGTFDSWTQVVQVVDLEHGPTVTHHGHTVLPDGEHVEAPETLRFRSLTQLTQSLRTAGFALARTYGDWDRSPARDSSEELIVIARRPS